MINKIQKHCAKDTIRNQNKTKTHYSARRALQNTHQTKQKHIILPDERTPPNEDTDTNPHPTQSQNHQHQPRLSRQIVELEHPGPGPRAPWEREVEPVQTFFFSFTSFTPREHEVEPVETFFTSFTS